MKLKIKHLAPYLPYGLEMIREDKIHVLTVATFSYRLDDSKPILHPLSYMYSIDEIMDEFSEYSLEQFELSFFTDLGRSGNSFDFVNYTIMELFFKHHIDVFTLIPEGFAIDVNTIMK